MSTRKKPDAMARLRDAIVADMDEAQKIRYQKHPSGTRTMRAVRALLRERADAYADDNRPCGPCCDLNSAAIRALAEEKGASREA